MQPHRIQHKEIDSPDHLAAVLPCPISARVEDVQLHQRGCILVKVLTTRAVKAKFEFIACKAKIVPDARKPEELDDQEQNVLFFGAYAQVFKHYKAEAGHYIYLKDPLIERQERSQTRVLINVKPTARRKLPEVIFISLPPPEHEIITNSLLSNQQHHPVPTDRQQSDHPPVQNDRHRLDHAVAQELNNETTTSTSNSDQNNVPDDNDESISLMRQDAANTTHESVDRPATEDATNAPRQNEAQELLDPDDLVAALEEDSGINENSTSAEANNRPAAIEHNNIGTSTPEKIVEQREAANISPIPSTSKQGSQDNPRGVGGTSSSMVRVDSIMPQPHRRPFFAASPTRHQIDNRANDRVLQRGVYAEKRRKYMSLNECTANKSKYNTYAVVTEIVRMPSRVNNPALIVSKLKIKDESLHALSDFRFDILVKNMQEMPSLEVGAVFRIHEMKVEVFNGIPDGRVFSGYLVTVVQGGVGSPIEPVCSNPNKDLSWCQDDTKRVEELREWYQYTKQGGKKEVTIEEMTAAGLYNLYCKLVVHNVSDTGQHLLRVEDGTISTIRSVEHPDEESQDVFGRDKSHLDIYLVDENLIQHFEKMEVATGSYLHLENVTCIEADAIQSQNLMAPLKIFKFTLDRHSRISIANTQCAALRERLGDEVNLSQDSYINKVLAMAQNEHSMTKSRLTETTSVMSQNLRVESQAVNHTSANKQDQACQTPAETRNQAIQTPRDIEEQERLAVSKRRLFSPRDSEGEGEEEEGGGQGGRGMGTRGGKRRRIEQEGTENNSPAPQPEDGASSQQEGQGSSILPQTRSASPNSRSRTSDESSLLPPGQWSYQRQLRQTPSRTDTSNSQDAAPSKSQDAVPLNNQILSNNHQITDNAAAVGVYVSSQHVELDSSVLPATQSEDNLGLGKNKVLAKAASDARVQFRESYLPLVPYTQSQPDDEIECQEFYSPPTSPRVFQTATSSTCATLGSQTTEDTAQEVNNQKGSPSKRSSQPSTPSKRSSYSSSPSKRFTHPSGTQRSSQSASPLRKSSQPSSPSKRSPKPSSPNKRSSHSSTPTKRSSQPSTPTKRSSPPSSPTKRSSHSSTPTKRSAQSSSPIKRSSGQSPSASRTASDKAKANSPSKSSAGSPRRKAKPSKQELAARSTTEQLQLSGSSPQRSSSPSLRSLTLRSGSSSPAVTTRSPLARGSTSNSPATRLSRKFKKQQQQAVDSSQQATGSSQQATGSSQQATGSSQQATGSSQQAAASSQQATGSSQQSSNQSAAGVTQGVEGDQVRSGALEDHQELNSASDVASQSSYHTVASSPKSTQFVDATEEQDLDLTDTDKTLVPSENLNLTDDISIESSDEDIFANSSLLDSASSSVVSLKRKSALEHNSEEEHANDQSVATLKKRKENNSSLRLSSKSRRRYPTPRATSTATVAPAVEGSSTATAPGTISKAISRIKRGLLDMITPSKRPDSGCSDDIRSSGSSPITQNILEVVDQPGDQVFTAIQDGGGSDHDMDVEEGGGGVRGDSGKGNPRRRRKSSPYEVPIVFKHQDNFRLARQGLKLITEVDENEQAPPRRTCQYLKNMRDYGECLLLCRILSVNFPYGDEAHMCDRCGSVKERRVLKQGRKVFTCCGGRGVKVGRMQQTMYFNLKVIDHTKEEIELVVFGRNALKFCGNQVRSSQDPFFTSLANCLAELRILVTHSDSVEEEPTPVFHVEQSYPNPDAWKADNKYDDVTIDTTTELSQ